MAPEQVQSSFDSQELVDIARQVRSRLCVPFLGAAVNNDMRLGGGVASGLVEDLEPLLPCDPESLTQVSWQYELRKNRYHLYRRLKQLLPDDDHQPSNMLRLLSRLPFKLIITTNFDRLLERALNDQGKLEGRDYVVIVQPDNGWDITLPATRQQFDQWKTFSGLWVYKIHGTFQGKASQRPERTDTDSSDSVEGDLAAPCELVPPMTVTEEDYIRFLTAMGNSQHGQVDLPDFIEARIRSSTLLFLGYGLQDWNIRVIYNRVVGKVHPNNRNPAFAVQRHPQNLWKDYWSLKRVNVRSCDVQVFADLLDSAYTALRP